MPIVVGPGIEIGPGITMDTAPAPVTAGLVLNLDAGDVASYPGSGTTWTDTVGGKIFTLYSNGRSSPSTSNPPVYSSSNGGYLTFNSAVRNWARSTVSLASMNSFTAEGWWYITSGDTTTGNTTYCIVTERMQPTNFNNYAVGYASFSAANTLSGGYYQGGWVNAGTDALSTRFGTWMYQTVTYNNTTFEVKSYINGVQNGVTVTAGVSNRTPVANNQADPGIHVGTRWDRTNQDTSINFLNGRIAVVRLYNAALTPTQITQNYNAEKGRFGLT